MEKYTNGVIQLIPLILGTNSIFEKIIEFWMITIINIEYLKNIRKVSCLELQYSEISYVYLTHSKSIVCLHKTFKDYHIAI